MWENPSIEDFKTNFPRDFPYNEDPALGVTDTDIANAFKRANISIMPGYYPSQETYNIYYLLLAAHYLVTSLQASSSGVGGFTLGFMASKSVGGVSVSYNIPQKYLDNPQWAYLARTNYGAEYLAYLFPLLAGAIFTVPGSTRA